MALSILVVVLLALLPLGDRLLEYGSAGWLWALLGLYQRAWLDGGAGQDGSRFVEHLSRLRTAMAVVAPAVYVVSQQIEFKFAVLPLAVVVVLIVALSVCLSRFKRGASRIQPGGAGAVLLHFLGTRTLELYAASIVVSILTVKALPFVN